MIFRNKNYVPLADYEVEDILNQNFDNETTRQIIENSELDEYGDWAKLETIPKNTILNYVFEKVDETEYKSDIIEEIENALEILSTIKNKKTAEIENTLRKALLKIQNGFML